MRVGISPRQTLLGMDRHLPESINRYLTECFVKGATPRVTEFTHRWRLSRFATSRAARRLFGCTLRDLFHGRQVVEAQRALMDGLPAAAAARRAGFTNSSTFFRTFRKYTGTTPAAFAHKVGVDRRDGRR